MPPEYLVAFSCQRRGFCPSCAAKRGALFGVFLTEDVIEDVGHCLWTFTVPKILRPYFLHHRELLGRLCRAGWEVVRELMATAVDDPTFQPGMVAVVQTYGDRLDWHPHVHAIATRGGWGAEERFVPHAIREYGGRRAPPPSQGDRHAARRGAVE